MKIYEKSYSAAEHMEVSPTVDLRILANQIWRGKWLIISATFLMMAAGILLESRLQPTFTSTAQVILGDLAPVSDADDLDQVVLFNDQRISTAVEIFYSTRVLLPIARSLLDEDLLAVDFNEAGIDAGDQSGVLGALRSIAWPWRTPPQIMESNSGQAELEMLALTELRRNLNVDRVDESSIINVSFTSHDPFLSALVANSVAEQYSKESLASLIQNREQNIIFLQGRLETISSEIRRTEDLIDARHKELSEQANGWDGRRSFALGIQLLESDLNVLRATYERVYLDLINARDRSEMENSGVQLLSAAMPPDAVDTARTRIVLTLGGLTGFLVGLSFVAFREIFDKRIKTIDSVAAITRAPVIGRLPVTGRARDHQVIESYRGSRDIQLTEAARSFGAGLLALNHRGPLKTIMVASPSFGEGGSTVAYVAALQTQRFGLNTLLIDCTGEVSASLRELKGRGDFPASGDLFVGDMSLSNVFVFDDEVGLSVLSWPGLSMKSDANDDLLAADVFREILPSLRDRFDCIVFNVKPVLTSADAQVIAPYADRVVLAVKWNATKRAELTEAVELLSIVGSSVAGCVFTSFDRRRAQSYSLDRN